MTQLNPYIAFDGNCEEAINFYKDCLGGEILTISYFEGAPMDIPEDAKKRIMHISMKFEGGTIMASDSMPNSKPVVGNNISLSIGLDSIEMTEKYFNNLSDGGDVIMPLQDTFWGARFGMLTDKYGIKWMLNCELKK